MYSSKLSVLCRQLYSSYICLGFSYTLIIAIIFSGQYNTAPFAERSQP